MEGKGCIMDNLNLIAKTFEDSIGKEVYFIHKYDNVPNNQVYKIETDSQPFIFKIYARRICRILSKGFS